MNKKLHLLLLLCLLGNFLKAQENPVYLQGIVLSQENNGPLPGALVILGDRQKVGITDESGRFSLAALPGPYRLKVTYLGMEDIVQTVTLPAEKELLIYMNPDSEQLEEVTVMSTGYQNLPAERVTGSFVALDKELLTRRVSSNFLERIEDVAPGVIANRGPGGGGEQVTIRGRSTLFSNAEPLIVVDNFPYDGPLESINPNDIARITVLKDAAAASIWGARAGNGVIVVTTKNGTAKSAPSVSFNSSVNLFQETDPYYVPQMKARDFIDIERQLFDNNYYNSQERSPNNPVLSPVVETLIAQREGKISDGEAEERIAGYENQDFRRDLSRYYYRPRINQQYALSVSGGSDNSTYLFSMGYDRNRQEIHGNEDDRWTLQAKNSWKFLDDKLTWSVGAYLTKGNDVIRTEVPSSAPYASLMDQNGLPGPIFTNLSSRYLESIQGGGLLDWYNVPLNELEKLDRRSDRLDGRFQTSLDYELLGGLTIGASYQYWTLRSRSRNRHPGSSYFVRDLVNRFTRVDSVGNVTRPLPEGDILDLSETFSYSHTFRSQINYQKSWAGRHKLSFLAGTEIRNLVSESNRVRYYGYVDHLATSSVVDFLTRYPYYYNPSSSGTIDSGTGHSGLTDRFVSFYSNMGYTFRNKWDATFSIRKDQSNFFGVDANQKGVPLWSTGLGWTMSEEPFADFLDGAYVKWRASYGYSGNLDKGLTGQLTAYFSRQPSYELIPNMLAAYIQNPPNPDLRWEKVGIWNVGIDLESKSGKYSGTLEFYGKEGQDLISPYDVTASTGLTRVTGNFATTYTHGMDLVLGAQWLNGVFAWRTDLFYSKVKDEVTRVEVRQTANALLSAGFSSAPTPQIGQPFFGIYSLPWAGLNPDTGDPMGYLDGEPSDSYSKIISGAEAESLVFHGSARPTDFGALRNTFRWKGLSLSVNISYRFGYYYRRRSIDYSTLLRGQYSGAHGDYEKRWKQPGDEMLTEVPSMPTAVNSTRNFFYMYSEALVERGDHIRLQDVRFGYSMDKGRIAWFPFPKAEFYAYANNLGIIWKASKDQLDPDFQRTAPRKSFALGLSIDF